MRIEGDQLPIENEVASGTGRDSAKRYWSIFEIKFDIEHFLVRENKSRALPVYFYAFDLLINIDARHASPVHPRAFEIVTTQSGRIGTLSNKFAELLVSAGLREARLYPRSGSVRRSSSKRATIALSFHSLRHTAVSLLKDAGIPDSVVQALVGHESTAMSHRYTHVGKESLSRATDSLPEI